MKHPILVNRQRCIKTLSDKAELTGFRFVRPSTLPDGAEPFVVIDVDGKTHDTIIKRNTDKKDEIGVYDENLAGIYHGRLSRHWKPETHTADGIIKILNAGYSVAPGLYDNPPDKSHRSGNYRAWTDVVLFDGDEWTDAHPAPENIDASIERYPTLPDHFYWIADSISSHSSLKPYLTLRLMMILPEPIHRDDPWTWNAMVEWVTDLYPFVAAGVASDKVRLSFGNARPDRSERRFNKVLDIETLNTFRQNGAAALAEHVIAGIEKAKQRKNQTERREKSERITAELKAKGVEIPDTQEPISTFNETDIETLLIGLGCSKVKGNDWHWHESGQGKSFVLHLGNPPVIETYSNSIKAHNPNANTEKPVEAHRLVAYYLYGLDMSKDSDKPELRKRLAADGYGTSPEEYQRIQEIKRNAAIEQGVIPPQREKRYTTNTRYKHNTSDIDTERDANKTDLVQWLQKTENTKGKCILILGRAPGTAKTTACIFEAKTLLYIAKTTEEADKVFQELYEKGEDVIRHRSRMFNYNHPDWETLPLGLGENERACIEPLLCNEHAELLGSPNEVCARCPFYIECKDNGYLSQAEKEKNTSKVVYSWGESFICDENLASRLKRICTKDKVFILDEANPLGFTQLRKIDRGMLYDLTERFRHTLGTEHEIYQTLKTLLDLISTTEEPTDFINGVSDWITSIDDIEELDDKIGKYPVQITFHHAPSTAEHNQPFIATLRYQEKVSTDVPVVDFETHETTEAFYTEEPITIESPETRFMAYGFLLKVGLASLNEPPRRYQNFLKDIKTFLDENNNLDAAPFSFDAKEQSFSFHLKPTLNHRRVIINTASDPDHLIEEAYKGTDIQITRHDGTPPVWKTNLVFQVASGAYLPRHSLIAKDGKKLKLKRYAEDMIESFIKPSLKSGLKTLVIAPKAFQEIESVRDWAVIDPDDYIPGQNAILTNHHRAEGRNDYQDCDIVFEFHYEPNHHDIQILAKHIYRNAETPLNFTREKQTVSVNGVTFEKNVYTDPRVQTIYNRECRSRLMQGPMRLRPNIHKDKIIVILTAEPIDIPITPVAFTPRDQKKFNGDWADFKKQLQATPKERIAAGESKSKAYRDSDTHKQKKTEREAKILELHQQGKSQREIERLLKETEYKVSRKTISNVIEVVQNSQSTISNSYSRMGKMHHPTNPDDTNVESETLHTGEVERDYDMLFKLFDISACFYGKKQRSPSDISRFTGIDESEVRKILEGWYKRVVISPGVGDQYWMSERDTENLNTKILAPTLRAWGQKFPEQKILCPPIAFNPSLVEALVGQRE